MFESKKKIDTTKIQKTRRLCTVSGTSNKGGEIFEMVNKKDLV